MILAIAALALFPSQTDITLSYPAEDDGLLQPVFTADGSSLLLPHFQSGSVTRVDIAQGAVVERLDLGDGLVGLKLGDNGAEAFALERLTPRLHKIQPSPLASLSAAPLSLDLSSPVSFQFGFQIDANSTAAVVWTGDDVSVVDLVSMTELRVIPLPPAPQAFFGQRVHLAADGQSILVLRMAAGSTLDSSLERIDLATGNVLATILLPTAGYRRFQSTESRDLILYGRDGSGDRILRLDGATGATLADTTFLSPGIEAEIVTTRTGDRALLRGFNEFYLVPLTTGTMDAQSPGVSTYLYDATEIGVSGDFATIITIKNDPFSFEFAAGDFQLIDSTTAGTRMAATGRQRFIPGVFSAQDDRFCLLGSERVRIYDVPTADQGPLVDTASGPGPEFDGAYELVVSADGRRGVAVPSLCDFATFLDLENHVITGSAPLGRAPTSIARQGSDRALVGHEDGTLAVLDIGLGLAIGSLQIVGSIVEIHPIPGTSRAWVRTDGIGGDALVLLDTAVGEIRRFPLAGSARLATDITVFRAPTLAIDDTRSRCYALGLDLELIEAIDLNSGAPLFSVSTTTAPFNQNAVAGSLELSPDGTKLLRGATVPAVEVYDVTMQGLASAWEFAFDRIPFQQPKFSGDGSTVFHNAKHVGSIIPEGPNFAAYDAATGANVGAIAVGLQAIDIAVSGNLVAAIGFQFGVPQAQIGSFTIASYRAGGPFTDIETVTTMFTAFQRFTGPLVMDTVRGKLYRGVSEGFPGTSVLRTVDLFEGRTQTLCDSGLPNATGVQATLTVAGSPAAGEFLTARVAGLTPSGMFGLLVIGDSTSAPMPIIGSRGSLCVSGTLGRFNGQVQTADASGTQNFSVNTASVPNGNGLAMVQPGSTWAFQTWHRDTAPNGAATSNTSTAVAITFR